MALVPQYLMADEEARIHRQFQGDTWRRNHQVLWSGILREEAQHWADDHEMQTLSTAMGPLMDLSHPLCERNKKTSHAWSKYVKGASAIFAWYISRGESVTVLSPPPPDKFHPSGQTSYQVIEEPIVKGMLGTSAVSRIEMVHPTVKGAENIYYQIWPVDDTPTWTARFGEVNVQRRPWRMVRTLKALLNGLGDTEIAKAYQKVDAEKEEEEEAKREKREKKKIKKAKKRAKKKAKKLKKEEKAKVETTKVQIAKGEIAKEEIAKEEKKEKKAKKEKKEKKKTKRAKKKAEKLEKEEKTKEKAKVEIAKEETKEKEVGKAKKEKKKAIKKAKKLKEKEENANNQGRSEIISEKVATEEDDGWLV